MPVRSKWQSLPTEQINPATLNIDKLAPADIVEGMLNEDRKMLAAVQREKERIAVGVEIITQALRKNGRIIFVGAGTSGRLGVLDASEIPPTFGASPELVQGIIAGGATALHRSVEGAEDETSKGALAIDRRGVKDVDVVIGITASGRTPFVLGALGRAKSLGAKTVLLSCNPVRKQKVNVDLAIDLEVGPEILTGSTRLKAGTATKVALNIISTGTMVALGKVRGNLMIDLNTSSTKLRDRATRMVADLTESDYNSARALLEQSGWDLRAVLKKAGK
jgi:N-acetylmuramic acid 6-phosphate etherase